MSYISHLYSIYFAPRGNIRMAELGMQIAQQYLRPTDKLIGVIGDAGSGKSMLVKGMFPGLELTNDDEGVNVRPLPLLEMLDDPLGMGSISKKDFPSLLPRTPIIWISALSRDSLSALSWPALSWRQSRREREWP